MALQPTERPPTRSDTKAAGDGWTYVMLAIIVLAAIVLVVQVAPHV